MQKQKDTNNCSTVLSDCGENYANACISMITKFHESINRGPQYICTCCGNCGTDHQLENAMQPITPNAKKTSFSPVLQE